MSKIKNALAMRYEGSESIEIGLDECSLTDQQIELIANGIMNGKFLELSEFEDRVE